jgi:hypothetical protein
MQFYSSSNYLKSHNNLDLEIKLKHPQNQIFNNNNFHVPTSSSTRRVKSCIQGACKAWIEQLFIISKIRAYTDFHTYELGVFFLCSAKETKVWNLNMHFANYARKLCKEINYPICKCKEWITTMLPNGESLGFESGARLYTPWVRLSSPDGVVVGDDTFLCLTFFVGLLVLISFFSSSRNFYAVFITP